MHDAYCGPSIVDADIAGTVACWRFHPSILAIVFNPREASLFGGNFGRWNFGGAGPDGSPRPFRLGQVGSVLSCPGLGDQVIHADTPHLLTHRLPPVSLFERFHPQLSRRRQSCQRMPFVHGSHRLSVSARLLSEDDNDHMTGNDDDGTDAAMMRRNMLQLRTLRPALDAGDILFFDPLCLANTSMGDKTGKEINSGCRPMLYLNVTQSWFHDPKNWDDRDRFFD